MIILACLIALTFAMSLRSSLNAQLKPQVKNNFLGTQQLCNEKTGFDPQNVPVIHIVRICLSFQADTTSILLEIKYVQ